jgi:hypothetical protein
MPRIIPETEPSCTAKPDQSQDPRADNTSAIIAAAKELHDRGFWVVPCDGKKAIWSNWPEQRRSWDEVQAALQRGGLNIAIALNQSDLIDVECDSPEAESNLQAMFGGKIPPTPTYRSSRGLHRLFRRPPGLPQAATLKIEGIEFRIGNGKGALSVVPPSIHPSGAPYAWEKGRSIFKIEPTELPANIVARLAKPAPKAVSCASGVLPEGVRNETLFKLGCHLFATGISEGAVESALQAENAVHCQPPLDDTEVSAIARSAKLQVEKMPRSSTGDETHAQVLMGIANACELWQTPAGEAWVTVRVEGHREHWPVRSTGFSRWLGRQFYEETKKVASSQAVKDVQTVIEGKARFEGPIYPTFVRVAEHEGRIYIDLADEQWRAVEVSDEGWRIVEDPPVRFRRRQGMLPLPEPVRGGSVQRLREFANVADEHWPLVLAWLVAAYRPRGPFPILKLLAEQGSGKTTFARVLRMLIDPNHAAVRSAPRSEQDLMIAANNAWVMSFDNLSCVRTDLSDALCRLSTGGGWGTRTLYANDEETLFDAQRPVILNGIEDIGYRSDLLDRCLIVELPRIEPAQRRSEKLFWDEFEKARPQILGALLDAVSSALANLPEVERSDIECPRMADFAMWGVAAEVGLGLRPGRFLQAYELNRDIASHAALESSPVVVALIHLLESKGKFEGTATQLLKGLEVFSYAEDRKNGWPKNARALSGQLSRFAPNLRLEGIVVDQVRIKNEKIWRIIGKPAPPQQTKTTASSQSSQKSKPAAKPGVLLSTLSPEEKRRLGSKQ